MIPHLIAEVVQERIQPTIAANVGLNPTLRTTILLWKRAKRGLSGRPDKLNRRMKGQAVRGSSWRITNAPEGSKGPTARADRTSAGENPAHSFNFISADLWSAFTGGGYASRRGKARPRLRAPTRGQELHEPLQLQQGLPRRR